MPQTKSQAVRAWDLLDVHALYFSSREIEFQAIIISKWDKEEKLTRSSKKSLAKSDDISYNNNILLKGLVKGGKCMSQNEKKIIEAILASVGLEHLPTKDACLGKTK